MADPVKIAARLTPAQRKALLAFDEPMELNCVNGGTSLCIPEQTAHDLGISGNTLMSMWGLGGVDPETLELGPILVSAEWGEGGKRYWSPSELGLAVRRELERERQS